MRRFIVLFFLILAVGKPAASQRPYRRDYQYNSKTKSYYKLHTEHLFFTQAQHICAAEGAQLLKAPGYDDRVQAHTLMKQYSPDIGEYFYVDDEEEFESAEEHPIIKLEPSDEDKQQPHLGSCAVLTREGELKTVHCSLPYPFFCKIESKKLEYNSQCDVFSEEYQYFANVSRCYKVSKIALTWNQAYAECEAESAHLVVLESEEQQQIVTGLLQKAPKAIDSRAAWFFFAGFRADKPVGSAPRVFRTVANKTLEETGFHVWSEAEPNNFQNSEYCGSLFKNNGKYNDVDCTHRYSYVCEKEVHH